MRFIIFTTILLASSWSGYWIIMSSKYSDNLYLWIDIESDDVSAKFNKIKGFPNRFDTTISDLKIKQNNFAPIKIDRLDVMRLSYDENHYIFAANSIQNIFENNFTFSKGLASAVPERLQANAIEAAEQCNILSVPEIAAATRLPDALADWPQDRVLIFCDEAAQTGAGLAALDDLKGRKLALLIGPEGGFDEAERAALRAHAGSFSLSLGPRILRTDTAVVAALALLQSRIGTLLPILNYKKN